VIVSAAVLGAAPAIAASGGVRIANVTRDRVSLPLTLRGPWRFQMVGLRWRGSGQVEVRAALRLRPRCGCATPRPARWRSIGRGRRRWA